MNKNIEKYLKGFENNFEDFENLLKLYNFWNEKINISSIKDEKEIIIKHFVDSLFGNEILDFENKKVLDLGTGGGFPLLPLAILNKKSNFYGLDSVQKKLKIIEDISEKLNLKVNFLHGRAEDFGQKRNYRESFDIVSTRAFAKFSPMCEMSIPFLRIGGFLIAYQGKDFLESIKEKKMILKKLGAEIFEEKKFVLPENFGERFLIVIKKVSKTPKRFPRKVGEPKNKPL